MSYDTVSLITNELLELGEIIYESFNNRNETSRSELTRAE